MKLHNRAQEESGRKQVFPLVHTPYHFYENP
jgi:hypothetical protein